MEKNLKKFKTLAVVLIVVLISAIAFGGLYMKSQGVWKNVLPEFSYGMEINGVRELRFVLDTSEEEKEVYIDADGNYAGDVVEEKETTSSPEIDLVDENGNPISSENTEGAESTETAQDASNENKEDELTGYTIEKRTIKANEDANINITNFEKAKKIIQERLETLDLYEYNIRLDDVTGELVAEVPDNDNVAIQESMIVTKGKFEVVDHQNGLVLLDNSNIEKVTSSYTNNDNGYQSYLIVQLNKDGTEKLKEISKNYTSTTDEEGNETKKQVDLVLDGETLLSTYFDEEIKDGLLQLSMGSTTNSQTSEQLQEYLNQASNLAVLLKSDTLPLTYKLDTNLYVQSELTNDVLQMLLIITLIVSVIIAILTIIKYKKLGLFSVISLIGYIAILLIALRYTNVVITIAGILGAILSSIMNYIYMTYVIKNQKNDTKAFKNVSIKFLGIYIPCLIISIVFSFMKYLPVASFGMVMFWSLIIMIVYNLVITRVLIANSEN